MNDSQDNPDDVVDRAAWAMRQLDVPAGPPADVRDAVMAAGVGVAERIRHMNGRRKILPAAAMAALGLIVIGVWALLPSDGKSGVAFAEVRAQIERARTMTVTAVAEVKGMRKPMTMKMFLKTPGKMRQEQTIDLEAFFPRAATRPASMPGKMVTISIFDMAAQKGIGLVPSQKKAVTFELKNMPPEAVAKTKDQDMLAALKKAVAGEHEELGDKTIGGRKARGYRCRNAQVMQATMDIWVDASTGTPLVVEMTTPESMGSIKVTMSDFVLDPVLDDSLFDVRPPAGYTVENQVMDYNVTEADVIQYLRFFADHFEGAFPRSMISVPELMEQLREFKKKGMKEPSNEEAKTVQVLVQKAVLFAMKTMQGGQFVYAGGGVKLGDKTTPILWYKAKDAKVYRVIYGDLSVRELEEKLLPKAPASRPGGEKR